MLKNPGFYVACFALALTACVQEDPQVTLTPEPPKEMVLECGEPLCFKETKGKHSSMAHGHIMVLSEDRMASLRLQFSRKELGSGVPTVQTWDIQLADQEGIPYDFEWTFDVEGQTYDIVYWESESNTSVGMYWEFRDQVWGKDGPFDAIVEAEKPLIKAPGKHWGESESILPSELFGLLLKAETMTFSRDACGTRCGGGRWERTFNFREIVEIMKENDLI